MNFKFTYWVQFRWSSGADFTSCWLVFLFKVRKEGSWYLHLKSHLRSFFFFPWKCPSSFLIQDSLLWLSPFRILWFLLAFLDILSRKHLNLHLWPSYCNILLIFELVFTFCCFIRQVSLASVTSIIDGLKKLYVQNLKPLEVTYRFNDFVSPLLVSIHLFIIARGF